MRVAIVGPADSFKSGISAYSDRLADAFARAGHETWYVPIRTLLPRFLFPGKPRGASATATERPYRMGPALDYHSPRSILAARRWVRQQGFDLVVVPWWTAAAAHMTLPLVRAAKQAGATVVVDVHETRDPREERFWPARVYGRWALRRIARRADLAVTHAGSLAKTVRFEVPEASGKVRVMPHPAYDQYGPRVRKSEARRLLGIQGKVVVLHFGLLRRYKGVADLVASLDHLPDALRRNAEVWVVGEAWGGRSDLAAALAASPHRDRVRVVDRYVPDAGVALWFSAADVVVLPYRRAAQSGVLGVAKSFSVPVVVSSVGGLPEAVRDYPWKAVCRPHDPASIARALVQALGQPYVGTGYRPYSWDDAVRELEAAALPLAAGA
ncbi:MAG TPA: glycosyltransferase [Candidatus Thermoplasmatota archaeon]|nr:glycosyltransferase [Candidatus Thermoplasmatota archaeon]